MFGLFRRKKPAGTGFSAFPEVAPPPLPSAPPPVTVASAGSGIHIPADKLTRQTAHLHYAITSLREELEAVDWYRQRADDTDDAALKAILLHNANEEIEHAAMLLEWLRRTEPRFAKELKEYLFTDGPITAVEQKAMGRE
jgi:ferritin-like protein